MAKYIPLDALVAKLKKIYKKYDKQRNSEYMSASDFMCIELERIISFINTLEVKEVDLEKEIENILEKEKAFVTDNREVKYYNGDSFNHIYELEFIAKHFFELGMAVSNKAQKG